MNPRPGIAGILLAAGRSVRMPGGSKLLLVWKGKPLVRWAAEALTEGGLSPIVAVAGGDPEALATALEGLPLHLVPNPRHAEGMGTSLAAGVFALGVDVEAAAVALGDMPLLAAATVRRLAAAFLAADRSIAVPLCHGRRGHPVLFDLRRHRPGLLGLRADEGARSLLTAYPDEILEVPVNDEGVLLDVDAPEDYQALEARPPWA